MGLGLSQYPKSVSGASKARNIEADESACGIDEEFSQAIETPGLPRLSSLTKSIVAQAQHEANFRQQCDINTEHLLFGLLRYPESTGMSVLDNLGVGKEKLYRELNARMRPTSQSQAMWAQS